jgi:hypothetical protein
MRLSPHQILSHWQRHKEQSGISLRVLNIRSFLKKSSAEYRKKNGKAAGPMTGSLKSNTGNEVAS